MNVTNNTHIDKLTLPLAGSSFESFFCLASVSSKILEEWRENGLHPSEKIEYDNIANSRRKYNYLLRSYCAKQAILPCLGEELTHAKTLHLRNSLTNQNILTSDRLYHAQLQVNTTHTETLGFAVAFEGLYPFGLDIEKIDLTKTPFVKSHLSAYEKHLIKADDKADDKADSIIAFWTAKEALCKALGGGLSVFSEATEISEVIFYNHYKEIFFKHFPAYRAYSLDVCDSILTISFPYCRRFQVNVNQLWEKLNKNEPEMNQTVSVGLRIIRNSDPRHLSDHFESRV